MIHFDGYLCKHKHSKKVIKPTKQVSKKCEVDRVCPAAYPRSGDRFKISKF